MIKVKTNRKNQIITKFDGYSKQIRVELACTCNEYIYRTAELMNITPQQVKDLLFKDIEIAYEYRREQIANN